MSAAIPFVEKISPVQEIPFEQEWYEIIGKEHFWFEWRTAVGLKQLKDLEIPLERSLRILEVGCGTGLLRSALEAATSVLAATSSMSCADMFRLLRNTANLGFADVSARGQKNFELPNEKGKISVSAEMFNLFNFANIEIGSAQMTYGPNLAVPSTNARFGKIKDANGNYIVGSTLRTTPFQVQLGLRLEF